MEWYRWVLTALVLAGATGVWIALYRGKDAPKSCIGCGACIAAGKCVLKVGKQEKETGKSEDPS